MRDTPGMPQPCVEPLREQVSLLYKTLSKQVPETQVIHDSWCLRKFLGFVKMKTRIHKPSTVLCACQLFSFFNLRFISHIYTWFEKGVRIFKSMTDSHKLQGIYMLSNLWDGDVVSGIYMTASLRQHCSSSCA